MFSLHIYSQWTSGYPLVSATNAKDGKYDYKTLFHWNEMDIEEYSLHNVNIFETI